MSDLSFLDDFEYDRAEEESDLWMSYKISTKKRSKRQLVLLTASSGSGKSWLARKFGEFVSNDGGVFLSGKSDPLQRCAYAPFAAALAEFTSFAEQRGPDFVESIRKRVHDSVLDVSILTDMMPVLVKILGESTDCVSRKITKKEVALVFSKFLEALASAENPIVLFFDDLQWMDPESLDLLKVIACLEGLEGVMLLGTCRGDEVSLTDPLAVLLRDVEDSGVSIINVGLENLDRIAIQDVISGLYDLQQVPMAKLALLLQRETKGNIFLMIECLRSLHEDGLLQRDMESGQWRYSDLKIQLEMGNISSFVHFKFKQLPEKLQASLLRLSCIGTSTTNEIARTILSSDRYRALVHAEKKGLLCFDDARDRIRFAHDFVQQALYETIDMNSRVELHLSLGRALLSRLPLDSLEANTLLVAGQLRLGAELVHEKAERDRLALFFLQAGRKASSTSSFSTALEYLESGVLLLSTDRWKVNYYLSLQLYNAAAEASLVCASFERAEALIDEILENALCLEDKLQAYSTKMLSLGARGEMVRALETGLAVVRLQGIRIPVKTSAFKAVVEVLRTRLLLAGKTDDDILRLPLLADPKLLPALRIMNLVQLYAYFANPEFCAIIAMRIIQLTVRHGLSDICPFSFGIYGALLAGAIGRPKEGYRYGQLSLRLAEHFKSTAWLPRVYACVFSILNPWVHHVEESIAPLKFAQTAALQSGDIEVSMLNGHTAILLSFSAGHPLSQLIPQMQKLRDLAISYGQHGILPLIEAKAQQAMNLLGRSEDVFVLTGDLMDQRAVLENARRRQNQFVQFAVSVWQCEIACLMLDYERATQHAEHARRARKVHDLWSYTTAFYEALSALALARECVQRRSRLQKRARRNLKYMLRFGRLGAPNFSHMIALVEAEFAWLHGRKEEAMAKYDESIVWAGKGGFLHHQGLAWERKAMTSRSVGDHAGFLSSMTLARNLFEEWGATVKLYQLDSMIGA